MDLELHSLADQTQQAQIDCILQWTVRVFEAVIPGRVRAYYLVGNQIDGSELAFSDIDVWVIFRDRIVRPEEKDKFLAFENHYLNRPGRH